VKKQSVIVDCPIDTTINVLKGKCKAGIILAIQEGNNRFGLIKRKIKISDKLLAVQLNELEEDQILVKERTDSNPLKVQYMLNEDGIKLCGIIKHMEEWGVKYKLYKEHQVLV
jgi:DNA-binding HxlR family transcriptional regulator